jgi:hypothetical protein
MRRSRGIQRTQSECFEEHLLAEFFPQDNHNYINDNPPIHSENNDFLNLQNPPDSNLNPPEKYIKTEIKDSYDLDLMKMTERKPYLSINMDHHNPGALPPPPPSVTPYNEPSSMNSQYSSTKSVDNYPYIKIEK